MNEKIIKTIELSMTSEVIEGHIRLLLLLA